MRSFDVANSKYARVPYRRRQFYALVICVSGATSESSRSRRVEDSAIIIHDHWHHTGGAESSNVCILMPKENRCVHYCQVRLFSILMDDVGELKEFSVKHCRVASFSNGGQYFAFANNAQVNMLCWLCK